MVFGFAHAAKQVQAREEATTAGSLCTARPATEEEEAASQTEEHSPDESLIEAHRSQGTVSART